MGISGIGLWELIIILGIVVLLFGTKKLRNIGSDLGGAIKGFKKSLSDDSIPPNNPDTQTEKKNEFHK